MIGDKKNTKKLFYTVDINDYIPEDHFLRLIDRHVDFSFIRDKVRDLYSPHGRPSIDPEVMIRMLLIGYLYDIRSERKLCEEVTMHIGYRWFCKYGLDEPVMHHSTFSKNRHGRFRESGIFREIFQEIVRQCIALGLVEGEHVTVDGTHVKANASLDSLEPVVVEIPPDAYLAKLDEENSVSEERDDKDGKDDPPKGPWEPGSEKRVKSGTYTNDTHRSKTDPDAKLGRKGKEKTTLRYGVNYLMDNAHRVILDARVSAPDRGGEQESAREMLWTIRRDFGICPESLGADKGYATGTFIKSTLEMGIQPHIPLERKDHPGAKAIYSRARFLYDPDTNTYLCPEGKRLTYHGEQKQSRQHVWRANSRDCGSCPVKEQCTRDRARSISFHIYDVYLQHAADLCRTAEYYRSQWKRKAIEGLFGEAKEFMGMGRAKFRRQRCMDEQAYLTATAQNIKRIVAGIRKKEREIVSRAALYLHRLLHEHLLENLLRWFGTFRWPYPAFSAI